MKIISAQEAERFGFYNTSISSGSRGRLAQMTLFSQSSFPHLGDGGSDAFLTRQLSDYVGSRKGPIIRPIGCEPEQWD